MIQKENTITKDLDQQRGSTPEEDQSTDSNRKNLEKIDLHEVDTKDNLHKHQQPTKNQATKYWEIVKITTIAATKALKTTFDILKPMAFIAIAFTTIITTISLKIIYHILVTAPIFITKIVASAFISTLKNSSKMTPYQKKRHRDFLDMEVSKRHKRK